jgi:hypothetical protein
LFVTLALFSAPWNSTLSERRKSPCSLRFR